MESFLTLPPVSVRSLAGAPNFPDCIPHCHLIDTFGLFCCSNELRIVTKSDPEKHGVAFYSYVSTFHAYCNVTVFLCSLARQPTLYLDGTNKECEKPREKWGA